LVAGCALALAGCAAEPEASPVATPGPVILEPAVTPTASADEFTPTMTLAGCAALPDDYRAWLANPNGDGYDEPEKALIGGTVVSPTGTWAAIGLRYPEGIYVILAPVPLEVMGETIQVGRQLNDDLDPGYEYQPGSLDIDPDTRMLWGFDNYTTWRGDLKNAGKEIARAAVACVSG